MTVRAAAGAVGLCAPRHAGVANSWRVRVVVMVMVTVVAMVMAPVIVSDRPRRRDDLLPIVVTRVWFRRETHGAVVLCYRGVVDESRCRRMPTDALNVCIADRFLKVQKPLQNQCAMSNP